jgi:hypothetical protein
MAIGIWANRAMAQDSTRSTALPTTRVFIEPAIDRSSGRNVREQGSLFRSTSSASDSLPSGRPASFLVVAPHARFISNGQLPYSMNDGALWAGRGNNASIVGGARVEAFGWRLFALPEWTYSENRQYDVTVSPVFPQRPSARSLWSSPFHTQAQSIDLPIRFGNHPINRLRPGQSSLIFSRRSEEIGISTENEWWGPGIQNALLLSNNAPGFAHLFLRTRSPLQTRIGTVEARWLVGALTESSFFDTITTNDVRSIALLGISVQPRGTTGLTLGAARSVYSPATGYGQAASRFLDVFRDVGQPDAVPLADTVERSGPDQLLSLFARWASTDGGFEVYAEWGRAEFPLSLRDFAEQPNHSQGYTIGFQRIGEPLHHLNGRLRLQAEATLVQQSTTFRFRDLGSWYTSRSVPQGYTNQGQVLGAAIGPGSSSQWVAFDRLGVPFDVGVYVNRIRWLEDARSQAFDAANLVPGNSWCEHDVSLLGGGRASHSSRFGRVMLDFSTGWRYDVFFKHDTDACPHNKGFDRRMKSVALTFIPSARR